MLSFHVLWMGLFCALRLLFCCIGLFPGYIKFQASFGLNVFLRTIIGYFFGIYWKCSSHFILWGAFINKLLSTVNLYYCMIIKAQLKIKKWKISVHKNFIYHLNSCNRIVKNLNGRVRESKITEHSKELLNFIVRRS